VTITPAAALPLPELVRLFNAGYSDYLVPLSFEQSAFHEHLDVHDVDLECSMVLSDPEPVAITLIARRASAGWVAGVGTAPGHRRRGHGEQTMTAALKAAARHGITHVDLEVIDRNHAAIALYRKLGFVTRRDLLVWSLPATGSTPPPRQPGALQTVQAWISEHAQGRDPWQRSLASAEALRRRGAAIHTTVAQRDGHTRAAITWREQDRRAIVLQIAAEDESSAVEVLLAAAGGVRDLRLANIEPSEPASRALEGLGARLIARQHEMRIRL
jgi:GNAT superfamily N-acetyltransferase